MIVIAAATTFIASILPPRCAKNVKAKFQENNKINEDITNKLIKLNKDAQEIFNVSEEVNTNDTNLNQLLINEKNIMKEHLNI